MLWLVLAALAVVVHGGDQPAVSATLTVKNTASNQVTFMDASCQAGSAHTLDSGKELSLPLSEGAHKFWVVPKGCTTETGCYPCGLDCRGCFYVDPIISADGVMVTGIGYGENDPVKVHDGVSGVKFSALDAAGKEEDVECTTDSCDTKRIIQAHSNMVLEIEGSPTQITGGQGDWQYVYEPNMLQMPEGANPPYSHGLEVDAEQNIYLVYRDTADSNRCLVRWSASDGHTKPAVVGYGSPICANGTSKVAPTDSVHGLRLAVEANGTYFYHANNNQALFKTTLNMEIVWSVFGPPQHETDHDMDCAPGNCPTWFGMQPGSDYIYLVDGYGSNEVRVYTKAGKYTGHTFGGKGNKHGLFNINHAISWDARHGQMVVSDRSNHRLEYFNIDAADPSKFEYASTSTFKALGQVCNIRFLNDNAIVPSLEGLVSILDKDNQPLSSIDVKKLLHDKGFGAPHDAIFMPNGDFIVASYNPGRIAYWRRLPKSEMVV